MKRSIYVLVTGLAVLPFLTGCQTTTMSQKGDIPYQLRLKPLAMGWQTQVQSPINVVYKATLAGLDDLGVKPMTNQVDKLSGLVTGVFADEMDFTIRLECTAPKLTTVTIRSGLMVDKDRSVALFRALEAHLAD